MKSEDTISHAPQVVENSSEVKQEKAVVTSELEGIAKVRLEVIQSLIEPCDRATYGERLRSGAKKLDISVRSLQRLFKKYQEQGLTALVSTSRADKGNHRISQFWQDFILKTYKVRDIYDKLEIAVVLVGTDRLDAVIKRDEQVYNRFRANRRFGKLAGINFKNTVAIWEEKILKLPVASNLTNKTTQKILLTDTEGYIGRLDEVLREAAIASLSQGHKKVDSKILKEIAREYS